MESVSTCITRNCLHFDKRLILGIAAALFAYEFIMYVHVLIKCASCGHMILMLCAEAIAIFEPSRGKTNNVVSEQVGHKPGCTSTENG